ncbi:Cytoplasmic tRNA 2-thiolation protein 2 [Galemys pyrenaicus]|uniref:Cytoplasmic tRNA 2-thiolation protein 2 n=1 Tax=Galemys pyrenaicus TaxID=202257 RepID=A0A8J5ZPE0_GALPY|nr:Cytoplasmic tRNA 2-thiolation protein 2 [Galemys pyrenaicus]
MARPGPARPGPRVTAAPAPRDVTSASPAPGAVRRHEREPRPWRVTAAPAPRDAERAGSCACVTAATKPRAALSPAAAVAAVMCQVGEDYVEPAPEAPPPRPGGRGQRCVKCKEEPPILVIRAGDAFCRFGPPGPRPSAVISLWSTVGANGPPCEQPCGLPADLPVGSAGRSCVRLLRLDWGAPPGALSPGLDAGVWCWYPRSEVGALAFWGCFKALYTHKFRAVLGKHRTIFPGEKVLLAWSGGPSSSSMVWQVVEVRPARSGAGVRAPRWAAVPCCGEAEAVVWPAGVCGVVGGGPLSGSGTLMPVPSPPQGLSRDSAKRLRFVPGVVYVDEGAACGRSVGDRAQTRAAMEQALRRTGFPWHAVALEQVLDLPPSVLCCAVREPPGGQGAYKAAVDTFLQKQQQQRWGAEAAGGSPAPALVEEPQGSPASAGAPPAAQTQALCRLFDSVRSLTAREELLQTLRSHLVLHVARAHGYSKVMTGESCTRLAIKLMTGLALGRGAFLAWDTVWHPRRLRRGVPDLGPGPPWGGAGPGTPGVLSRRLQGFSDERHGDVVVVRPMREHTLKEVAFHNRLCAVPVFFTPAVDTRAPEKASIHRLMEAFVLRLQAQFPSTISTVYRTSEKLLKAPRDVSTPRAPAPCCLLCCCALDVDTAGLCWARGGHGVQSSALTTPVLAGSATAFGAQAAHLSQTPAEPPAGPHGAAGVAGRCEREAPGACLMEQLCYSCRVTMKDVPSLDLLPPYILAEARLRSQRPGAAGDVHGGLLGGSSSEADAGVSGGDLPTGRQEAGAAPGVLHVYK